MAESKSYMGYGKHISKMQFWLKYPRAFCRYWFFVIQDVVHRTILRGYYA